MPDTLRKSMARMTAGGLPKSGSLTTVLLTCASPEKLTLSGNPSTVPPIEITTLLGAARAEVPPQTRPPIIPTRSDRTTGAKNRRRIFIFRSFFSSGDLPSLRDLRSPLCPPRAVLEGGGEDVGRRLERHALGRRDRRRQRPQERGPVVVDLPPHEHGVVLVHRVVAVLHEHPAPVPELHRDGNAPARAA